MNKYRKAIVLSFIFIITITVICIGSSYSFFKLDKKGQIHNKITTGTTEEVCDYPDGYVWNFDYTGTEQEFTVPCNGTYKLETWGAEGGSNSSTYNGGYGAYAVGSVSISKDSMLYINVGGKGKTTTSTSNTSVAGGYNGGGVGWNSSASSSDRSSGGGATHIATISGVLSTLSSSKSNVLIVASGGGGSGQYNNYSQTGIGGSGGGITGGTGTNVGTGTGIVGLGGTQSAGGTGSTSGTFGQGGNAKLNNDGNEWGGSGGGGGYYGGGSSFNNTGAGGGSSYIGCPLLTDKVMYCYNCQESNEESTKTISTTCTNSTPTENCAKQGNGYARITLVNSNSNVLPPEITESGTFQNRKTITVTKSGEAKSGVKYYEYYVTQENITPTKETTPTGTTSNEVEINTVGINYIYYRTISNIGTKSEWSNPTIIKIKDCLYDVNQTWIFDYTGSSKEFIVPCNGIYKIEAWGAQGGGYSSGTGGLGAYTSGNIRLNDEDTLHIYVGEKGAQDSSKALSTRFNGGGPSGWQGTTFTNIRFWATGGGATDIRLVNGAWNDFESLKSRIMVAAGGGGGFYAYQTGSASDSGSAKGGYGGALTGGSGSVTSSSWANWGSGGSGGTQTSGGYDPGSNITSGSGISQGVINKGGFGVGGNVSSSASGGGGGYYGGGGSAHVNSAGGGSSFISGHSGCNAINESSTSTAIAHTGQAMHYSGYVFTNTQMIAGNASMPNKTGGSNVTGNSGNGYARITLISIN